MSVRRIIVEVDGDALDACWHPAGDGVLTLSEHLEQCSDELDFVRWVRRASSFYGFHFHSIKFEEVS
jgi:hypothetical protein